ncbi:hypothetical protein EDC30_11934 [Paucimonas lemoignei]|uniref:Uncharacterized protein n=1 Tax=Paucimonas lemoignei TaxID=29443 RepID=A0A4R3HS98_PAULE|nr:hypothetical protein [Paucimonas lemoignei]TCS32923.1 hypothetical protein EDC30_11934 [Paucimonas lemoignei]
MKVFNKKILTSLCLYFCISDLAFAQSNNVEQRFATSVFPGVVGRGSGYCKFAFVRQHNGVWQVDQSENMADAKVERLNVCMAKSDSGRTFDVLLAFPSSIQGCPNTKNWFTPRSKGYWDCNSEFSMSGLIGKGYSGSIRPELVKEAVESQAMQSHAPIIVQSIYTDLYSEAVKGNVNRIRDLLIDLSKYVTDEDHRALIAAYGKSTSQKVVPDWLFQNAKPEVVKLAEGDIRDYWIDQYRKKVADLMENGIWAAQYKQHIESLTSVANVWTAEDFDNVIPMLKQKQSALEKEEMIQEQLAAKHKADDNRKKAEVARRAEQQVALFRKSVQVGTWTNCGQIYDMRKPMAGVQTMVGQQYIDINRLYPPQYICRFLNGVYIGASN